MRELGPFSPIEQLFVERAQEHLPVGDARITRNDNGLLYYFWPSPCDDIEGLWAIIQEGEISLSTRIAHTHINRFAMLPDLASDDVEDSHIVEKSITKIIGILNGEVTFSRSYDSDGAQHSGGIGRLAGLADEIAQNREIFGEGITTRTWNWFGEVT